MDVFISLQLYTLRKEIKNDFVGTLEKAAAMGYKGVEFAGYGDMSPGELKSSLNRLGLKPTGSHTSIKLLENNLDEVIEYNLEIGNEYIICPKAEYRNLDDYIQSAKKYNEIGEVCRKKGIQFCYHNHAHEFNIFDGEYGLDIILSETDPDLVKVEIDTYWVQYAGINPVEYIKKYAGRCPIIHLKDMEPGEKRDFAEVGNGIMDIKGIIAAGRESGTNIFVVEQDKCKRPALESAAISFNNLKNMNM